MSRSNVSVVRDVSHLILILDHTMGINMKFDIAPCCDTMA